MVLLVCHCCQCFGMSLLVLSYLHTVIEVSCLFVFILRVCKPQLLIFRHEQAARIFATVSDGAGGVVDPAIGEAIKTTALTGIYLTQVIEDRLSGFAKRFSEGNSATVEQAVKKARCENYTCEKRGQPAPTRSRFILQVLDKFDEASDALKVKSYDKVKTALEAGTEAIAKRIKAVRLADKSEFGSWTVNEIAIPRACFGFR